MSEFLIKHYSTLSIKLIAARLGGFWCTFCTTSEPPLQTHGLTEFGIEPRVSNPFLDLPKLLVMNRMYISSSYVHPYCEVEYLHGNDNSKAVSMPPELFKRMSHPFPAVMIKSDVVWKSNYPIRVSLKASLFRCIENPYQVSELPFAAKYSYIDRIMPCAGVTS